MKSTFVLERSCLAQFDDPAHQGTRLRWDKKELERQTNDAYGMGECSLIDGYAPFCKHLFVPNTVGALLSTAEITEENQQHLQCDYLARSPEELPVLMRWFPADVVQAQVAKYLDVILYSREQIRLENAAMGYSDDPEGDQAPWGIIYIKAQDVPYELPMDPITILRNALGKEEGGSGVPLDRHAYLASVQYWSKQATIQ
ncbi:flagellar associated protein [Thraustotheca clavata]|uniref:Flagellar associated protein n=1 Tax=Thraustotheca clavata TaxID=74557 RepID=A0A1W0A0P5_9STRA|nr:flagellar associated protein [Thraustotheca clavata]